jgi:DNA-binding MarR family transcriptional regulator
VSTSAPSPRGKLPFTQSYLGYLLGQANHAVYKDFDAQVRKAGLSSIEWRVLATLHDREPLPLSDLAREVLAKQPTMTKLVQRMAQTGSVELLADSQDQRRTLVAITAQGHALVKPLVAAAKKRETQVMKALDTNDVSALKTVLSKLAQLS